MTIFAAYLSLRRRTLWRYNKQLLHRTGQSTAISMRSHVITVNENGMKMLYRLKEPYQC